MKNFLIFLFIFFLVFLLIAFIAPDSMFIFFYIYLALIIVLMCHFAYLGRLRGLAILVIFTIFPFLVEYLLSLTRLTFFQSPMILYLSSKMINLPITTANLVLILNIPTLFICSLFFSQKLKLLFNIKKYPKTFLIVISSLLFALNFLNIGLQQFIYGDAVKWLIIALMINLLASKFIKFNIKVMDFYKELPVILFLLIYSFNFALSANYVYLLIAAILLLIYLIALYNEHRYREINRQAQA